jgi:hypothetical protein
MKYEENLDEDKKMTLEKNVDDSGDKSLDLMKRLTHYLEK